MGGHNRLAQGPRKGCTKYAVIKEELKDGSVIYRAYEIHQQAIRDSIVWRGNSIRDAVYEAARLNGWSGPRFFTKSPSTISMSEKAKRSEIERAIQSAVTTLTNALHEFKNES